MAGPIGCVAVLAVLLLGVPAAVGGSAVLAAPRELPGPSPGSTRPGPLGGVEDPHLPSSPGAPHYTMATIPLGPARGGADQPSSDELAWLAFDPNDDSFWVAQAPSSVDIVPASDPYGPGLTLPVGLDPFGVAVDAPAGLVFVANAGSDNVTVISDATNSTVGSVPVGGYPQGVAVDPAAGEAFVANGASDNVTVVSVSTLTTTGNISVGADPVGLAFDPASDRLFVADRDGYTISVIDPGTQQVVATLGAGIDPYAVAIDNATDNVYVTNQGSNNLTVVNATTGRTVASVPIASGGWGSFSNQLEGIAYDANTSQMWVGDGWWYLVLVNTSTESVADFYSVDPCGLAYDSVDREIGLTNTLNTTFAILSGPRGGPGEGSARISETGLPTGTPWTVAIDNGSATTPTTASSQTLALNSYTSYTLIVPPTAGYAVARQPISIGTNDSSIPVVVNVTFARTALYPVHFLASGLSAGTGWSVGLGGQLGTTSSAAIDFEVPNGTYLFFVGPIDGYQVLTSSGSVTITGAPLNVTIRFAPSSGFALQFNETGLGNGTVWYLNATAGPSGATLPASGPIVGSFVLLTGFENGSYVVSVRSGDPQYRTLPILRFAVYNGTPDPSNATTIVFTEVTYAVPFQESGLPLPALWSVTLGGVRENATTAGLSFEEPNGSLLYSVAAPPGYAADPSTGVVSVHGASPSTVAIDFTSTATYPVDFRELGLPTGTGWAVAIGSQFASSTNASVTLTEPNGTYDYVVLDVPGYTANDSGSVTVLSGPSQVNVSFRPETYPVVVVEIGLPAGTNWSVTVSNASTGFRTTETTNGSALLFYLPNGTYALTVTVPSGYVANVTTATFSVAGLVSRVPSIGFAPVVLPTRGPNGSRVTVPIGAGPNRPASIPIGYGLVAVGVVAAVLGAALLMARRVRPPSGSILGPSGPLPADPSVPPMAAPTGKPRDPRRPAGDGPAEPLDDVF